EIKLERLEVRMIFEVSNAIFGDSGRHFCRVRYETSSTLYDLSIYVGIVDRF
ncbi:hypothetical protein GBA52_026126, partial [Prunus armeniaca]